jgi:hypothetical protein
MTTQTVPKGFVRAYLRASTTEQDATRALDTINTFAIERGLSICNYYIENESGSKLERPELFRLLKDCQQNDILLVEDVDDFTPGRGGLEHTEENDPAERYPGCGRQRSDNLAGIGSQ